MMIALAGAVLMLVLFFTGLHGEHYELGKWVGMLGIIFPIVGVPLGIRAWREQTGKGNMSYGQGLVAGLMISLWSGVGSCVFVLLYGMVINPTYQDTIIEKELAKLEAANAPAAMVETMEKVLRVSTNPAVQAVSAIMGSCILGLIIALIASAVLKRAAPTFAQPPPIA